MMIEMMEDIKNELKKNNLDIKNELKKNNEEVKQLREEMKIKEGKWNKEKGQMRERITELEYKVESEERKKKKNNVVVMGIESTTEQPKEEIESLFQKEMGVVVNTKSVYKIGRKQEKQNILVQLQNWEDKVKIMKNKNKLKGKNIYIENDMTKEEQKIQAEIRNVARKERAKGKNTKKNWLSKVASKQRVVSLG